MTNGEFALRTTGVNSALALISYDHQHHRIVVIGSVSIDPEKKKGRMDNGLDHVAFTFNTIDDLWSQYARLKAAGVTPAWPVHHGVTFSMYYEDPDGNRCEVRKRDMHTHRHYGCF